MSGIRADWRGKVAIILDRLDASTSPKQLDLPRFYFHPLTGDQAVTYSVLVSRNWRLTFGWHGEDAIAVDLEDYQGQGRTVPSAAKGSIRRADATGKGRGAFATAP